MDSLIELLDQLEKRPAMYIGERSISCLHAFIQGWMMSPGSASEDSKFIVGFQQWIQERYRIESTQSWAMIITFYSSDQYAALEEGIKLLLEYRDIYKTNGPVDI